MKKDWKVEVPAYDCPYKDNDSCKDRLFENSSKLCCKGNCNIIIPKGGKK